MGNREFEDVRELLNALSPSVVTPSGIVTFVRLSLNQNDCSPITVTGLPSISDGIITSELSPVYLSIVTPSDFIF